MAGKNAGFITGANAKISMFDETVAFATDVSYDVTIDTIPVEAIGKYEVFSYEPVGYRVAGALSIIRYTKRAITSGIDGVIAAGNQPSEIGDDTDQGSAQEHLSPQALLISQTFDLDIFEQTSSTAANSENAVFRISDCRLTRRGMALNKRGVMTDRYSFVGILAGDVDGTVHEVAGSGYDDLS